MKKTNIFKLILLMVGLIIAGQARSQITGQLHIGDTGNQIATNIKVLPDGSGTIIAGYDYDIVSGAVVNAQMVLMKVNPAGTAILWQEKFGISGSNNLVNNMIITHDSNIVIVGTMGRSALYNSNKAAIMKFDSHTGSPIWQRILYDNAGTVGGEVFQGVTELGSAGNYALVAVGSHDARPGASDVMICMFRNSDGAFIYDETYNLDGSGGSSETFMGVCTSADGLSTYITGYELDDYEDGRVHMYTPGMYALGTYAAGAFVWSQYFDFSLPGLSISYASGAPVVTPGSLTLSDNYFVDIYLSGNKLIVNGGSDDAYTSTNGAGQSILRLNASDGSGGELWEIQSSNLQYANVSKLKILNSDHLINVETPTTAWFDPIFALTSSITSCASVVTDVTSLTFTTTATPPVKYTSSTPCLHSLLDVDLFSSNLYMAGGVNDPTLGYGKTDIYFVRTPSSVSLDSTLCDSGDVTGMLSVSYTNPTHTMAINTFVPAYVNVTPVTTGYQVAVLCGKNDRPMCNGGSYDSVNTTLTDVETNIDTTGCSFSVNATGTPYAPWGMIGYLWNIGGTVTWDATTSNTDNKTVVVPYSGSQVVTVTYYATDSLGDTCTTTRTITLYCQKPPCYDTTCTKLLVSNITSDQDSCTFKACAHICTPYTIVGYDWTVSSGSTVTTHHTSATSDCFLFTVPTGTAVTVSVVAHIVDFNYSSGSDPCCEADLSQRVGCGDTTTNGPCVDGTQSSLNYSTSIDKRGNCVFNLSTIVATLPGWTAISYSWSVNGAPGIPGGSAYTVNAVAGTTTTVAVTVTCQDAQGHICTYTMTVTIYCEGGQSPQRQPNNSSDPMNAAGAGDISIFPNPTNDAVTITSSNMSISNVQVIDVNGRKLIDNSYGNAKTTSISLSSLPPGSYLFRVNDTISKVVTKIK